MVSEYFSEKEAEAKIGKIVITLKEFSGVPMYTIGEVNRIYGDRNMWGVDIEWKFAHSDKNKHKSLIDGFSKDEYSQFLQEVN